MFIVNESKAKELVNTLQSFLDGTLTDRNGFSVGNSIDLEQKYCIPALPHQFENAEECWKEMGKHFPFGWVKFLYSDNYCLITGVSDEIVICADEEYSFESMLNHFTFADGTPFGKIAKG